MYKNKCLAVAVLSISLGAFLAVGQAHAEESDLSFEAERQIGIASYYSDKFQGRRTASGERYDRNELTAVHDSLPFGSLVRVTNLGNQRSVDLRINDRKNSHNRRLLDVSRQAARELGFVRSGLARVAIEVLRCGDS